MPTSNPKDNCTAGRPTADGIVDAHRKRLSVTSRKVVVAIPGGEIQYGRISKRLAVWWRGRRIA